jgi:hypothetical protein
LQEVRELRANRASVFASVRFHDAYIGEFSPKFMPNSRPSTVRDGTELAKAKGVPVDSLLDFTRNKALCLWHKESTPSLTYYPETNTFYCFGCGEHGDSVALYRKLNNCDFKTALKDLNKLS